MPDFHIEVCIAWCTSLACLLHVLGQVASMSAASISKKQRLFWLMGHMGRAQVQCSNGLVQAMLWLMLATWRAVHQGLVQAPAGGDRQGAGQTRDCRRREERRGALALGAPLGGALPAKRGPLARRGRGAPVALASVTVPCTITGY